METRPGTGPGATNDSGTTSPPPEKASVVEDFIDVFHAPSSVFARRTHSGFGLHLLIVSVIAAAFAFANRGIMSQIFDAESSRRATKMMADNPQLTQEMLEQARAMQMGVANFFGYIGTPILLLFMALFVWLFARVVSAKISYGQSALIATIAFIPRLLGLLVITAQVVLMDTTTVDNLFSLSLSPARFMDPDTANPRLFGLAGSFEVFSIWSTVLVGIGIAVMGKVTKARGFIAAAILFVLGTIPLLFR